MASGREEKEVQVEALPVMDNPLDGLSGPTIATLRHRHVRIAQLLVAGLRDKDIAEICGCSPTHVSLLKKQPLFKAYVARLQQAAGVRTVDIAASIAQLLPMAVQKMEELLGSGNESIALRAATDLLDRGGFGKVQRMEVQSISASISAEELADIRERVQRARELGLVPEARKDRVVSTIETELLGKPES